ncbi:MAG: PIN domain-containing protein [Verrucomicrobiota bacterium]|nr:PIN domain-containing protein [Verrucomicrobiota bacterium]
MDVKTLVDAGPLIGWFNANDQWHDWSVEALRSHHGVLHTTEIVLGEACHHLGGTTAAVHALLTLVRQGALVMHTIWPKHLLHTQELMAKFERMDPADASLVVLSELHPRAKLVTIDSRDFKIYRRFGDQTLSLLTP